MVGVQTEETCCEVGGQEVLKTVLPRTEVVPEPGTPLMDPPRVLTRPGLNRAHTVAVTRPWDHWTPLGRDRCPSGAGVNTSVRPRSHS